MKPVINLFLILAMFFGLFFIPGHITGTPLQAEVTTIEGTVVDRVTQQPLQGASVYLEGTTEGTSTNTDGYFSISVANEEQTLVISYVGYQTIEYPVHTLNISSVNEFTLVSAHIHSRDDLIVTADQAHMVYSGIYSDVKTKPLEDHMSSIPGMDMVSRANFAKDPVIRGLRDGRVNVMIDGMRMTPACVDGMDPITAYVETDNLESINLDRGGQNSSSAPGGTLNFNMVKPSIDSGLISNVEAGYHSVSNQQIYQGSVNYGQKKWAMRLSGTFRDAGDFMTGENETISLSGFRKGNVYGSILYNPNPSHDISLQYIGDFAADVGYPALIMDTRRADAHIAGLEHNWQNPGRGISSIKTKLYLNRIEHWMDDYDRDVTSRDVMTDMYMPMYGETTTFGVNSEMIVSQGAHMLTSGIELFGIDAFADMWMYHVNPDISDMYLLNLGDVSTQNAAISANYRYYTTNGWIFGADARFEAGLNKIGEKNTYQAEYPNLNNLEPTFYVYTAGITLDKEFSDRIRSGIKISDGYRMPDHMELYGYYIYQPLDGFFYYGNPGLEKERSSQAETSLTYGNERTNFHGNVSLWVNRMDNYITGNSIDDMFKRYQNMGTAVLTGTEIDLHYNFTNYWNAGTSLTYVFGQHSELDEPLPMIPPMKGSIFLQRQTGLLSLETRLRWAAEQNRIAKENSVETKTGSYALWDFFGRVHITNNIRLQVGVENILNTFYVDHLNVNSMPSPGRNLSVSVRYSL